MWLCTLVSLMYVTCLLYTVNSIQDCVTTTYTVNSIQECVTTTYTVNSIHECVTTTYTVNSIQECVTTTYTVTEYNTYLILFILLCKTILLHNIIAHVNDQRTLVKSALLVTTHIRCHITKPCIQGIRSVGSIHVINPLVSGLFSQCHVDVLKWIVQNVNNQSYRSLTTLCSRFLLSWGNQVMTKSAHEWSWSCDLHGW